MIEATESVRIDRETKHLLDELTVATGDESEELLRQAVLAFARSKAVVTPPEEISPEERFQRSLAVARRSAARPLLDSRAPDEIIGYSEFGLPE